MPTHSLRFFPFSSRIVLLDSSSSRSLHLPFFSLYARLKLHSRRLVSFSQFHHPSSVQSSISKIQSEPLRILFCGSDDVSVACLNALDNERRHGTSTIQSIDVVCRPQKKSGHGGKTVRKRPVVDAAQSLELPLHEIDTFTGWDAPVYSESPCKINLIIAVSFGLFVPPRLLNGALYGGLNVHPSLLPDLRGAAPLHWTLLYGDKSTGVTLQTLHPEKFDHGTILKQTVYPGLPVPQTLPNPAREEADEEDSQYNALSQLAHQESAKILIEGLRERVYIPPLQDVGWNQPSTKGEASIRKAPKIKDEHSHIDWSTWSAHQIILRQRLLGSVWSSASGPNGATRLKFSKPFTLLSKDLNDLRLKPNPNFPPGCLYVAAAQPMPRIMAKPGQVMVNTSDSRTFRINEMTTDGTPSRDPLPALVKLQLVAESEVKGRNERAEWTYWKLREPLS